MSGMNEVSTYAEAVQAFIDSADWLSDIDLPGVMTLKTLAKHLDGVEEGKLPQAALVSQFNMAFRDLRNRAPRDQRPEDDPVAAAIRKAEAEGLW